MPKLQKFKESLDWIIRLQGAYAILSAIIAGSVGTSLRAILKSYSHLSALWITPIWLLSSAIVFLVLLFLASRWWSSAEYPDFEFGVGPNVWQYNRDRDITVFYLAARILNKGAASIAQNWSATYKVGAAEEPMKAFYLVGPTVLTIGKEKLTIQNDDLLTVKTAEEAIEQGGAVYGRLVFSVPGNRAAQIKALQHKIEIRVEDYRSRSYSALFVPSSVPPTSLIRHPHENAEFIHEGEAEKANVLDPPLEKQAQYDG